MRAYALRSTDHGAQVVRIGHTVQQDQEGILAAFLCQRQHVFHGGIMIGTRKGQQSLMVRGDLVQTSLLNLLHRNMRLAGHLHDLTAEPDKSPFCTSSFSISRPAFSASRMGLRPESRFSLGVQSAGAATATGAGAGRRCSN